MDWILQSEQNDNIRPKLSVLRNEEEPQQRKIVRKLLTFVLYETRIEEMEEKSHKTASQDQIKQYGGFFPFQDFHFCFFFHSLQFRLFFWQDLSSPSAKRDMSEFAEKKRRRREKKFNTNKEMFLKSE